MSKLMRDNLVALLRRPYGNLTFAEKQEVANLIEELEAKLGNMELDCLFKEGQAMEEQLAAEAKLEKVATRLQHIAANKISDELSVVEWDTHDAFSILDGCILSARATLAELKGQGDAVLHGD